MTDVKGRQPPPDLATAQRFINWFTAQERIPISSPRRRVHIVRARRMAWLALSVMGYSTVQIGQLFARDHSTVVAGLQAVRKDPRADGYARAYINAFRQESSDLMELLKEAAAFIRRAPGVLALLEDRR